MSITNTDRVITYLGNGSTFAWPYAFKMPADAVNVVIYEIATGETTEIAAEDYTVDGLGEDAGGTVTYPLSGDALSSAYRISIYRTVPHTQPITVLNQTRYYADVVMEVWDNLTMMVQDLGDESARSPKVPLSSYKRDLFLPDPEEDITLVGNSAGTGWVNGPSAASISSAQGWAERAEAAAASVTLGAPYGFRNVPELEADMALSYTAAPGKTQVTIGWTILAGEFLYSVAAADAASEYLETAGGVRLYESGMRFSTEARFKACVARGWIWQQYAVVQAGLQTFVFLDDGNTDLTGLPGWAYPEIDGGFF